jgi:DNA-directed RNA polymerase specialized sigma24 family protein
MLQDSEEASEITQEAFLAAWMGLLSFRGEARFAAWLYRIAYNCALKQLERHIDRFLTKLLKLQEAMTTATDGLWQSAAPPFYAPSCRNSSTSWHREGAAMICRVRSRIACCEARKEEMSSRICMRKRSNM